MTANSTRLVYKYTTGYNGEGISPKGIYLVNGGYLYIEGYDTGGPRVDIITADGGMISRPYSPGQIYISSSDRYIVIGGSGEPFSWWDPEYGQQFPSGWAVYLDVVPD